MCNSDITVEILEKAIEEENSEKILTTALLLKMNQLEGA